jgi:hypothetical protein
MFILFSGFDILHLFYTQTCVAIFLNESCPSNITHMVFGSNSTTQDDVKHNTTQYVLDTTIRKQAQIT